MRMKVHRTRATREEWRLVTQEVTVKPGLTPRARKPGQDEGPRTAVLLEFEMASAGGGRSRVVLSMDRSTFWPVLEAMMEAEENFDNDLNCARLSLSLSPRRRAAARAADLGEGGRAPEPSTPRARRSRNT